MALFPENHPVAIIAEGLIPVFGLIHYNLAPAIKHVT